jgi:hypothetical protein
MIKDGITFFNNRIEVLPYFDNVLGLAEKIEKAGLVYPAIYNNDNEYTAINLDSGGSTSYWRKNGDITFSKQTSDTSIGVQYTGSVPLKFIGFKKKDGESNDQFFADNICLSIIANLTNSNAALKQMLKAKKASLYAIKTVTDSKTVGNEEFDKVDFQARYTHAYFSIDFVLEFVTNSQCYADICNNIPFNWGFVTVTDGEEEKQIQCGTAYTCSAGTGWSATVENSDQSYQEIVASGDTLVLPDIHYNINVNGVLNQSFDVPALKDLVINIS